MWCVFLAVCFNFQGVQLCLKCNIVEIIASLTYSIIIELLTYTYIYI